MRPPPDRVDPEGVVLASCPQTDRQHCCGAGELSTIDRMRAALLKLIRRNGVVTRHHALRCVSGHVVDDAVRCGAVVAVLPGVYTLADHADEISIRRRAALVYRRRSALSHTDALDEWDLPTVRTREVHLTVAASEPGSRLPELTVHRRQGFLPALPHVVVRRGLRVVRLEQAIVESWPLLPDVDRRVPAIVAVRERRTTSSRLNDVLAANCGITGSAGLRELFGLIAAGCHSPLELWGHQNVFTDPRLPKSQCQVRVALATGVVYLDRLYEAEMVVVELDGAAYHGEPGQRERDLRRDAGLAALGYLTVRFSHLRLHADPAGCIAELLSILAMRRAQLRIAS